MGSGWVPSVIAGVLTLIGVIYATTVAARGQTKVNQMVQFNNLIDQVQEERDAAHKDRDYWRNRALEAEKKRRSP